MACLMLSGMPGLSLPVGLASNGLPIGIQFHARPFQDGLLLKFGEAVEGLFRKMPPPTSKPLCQVGDAHNTEYFEILYVYLHRLEFTSVPQAAGACCIVCWWMLVPMYNRVIGPHPTVVWLQFANLCDKGLCVDAGLHAKGDPISS